MAVNKSETMVKVAHRRRVESVKCIITGINTACHMLKQADFGGASLRLPGDTRVGAALRAAKTPNKPNTPAPPENVDWEQKYYAAVRDLANEREAFGNKLRKHESTIKAYGNTVDMYRDAAIEAEKAKEKARQAGRELGLLALGAGTVSTLATYLYQRRKRKELERQLQTKVAQVAVYPRKAPALTEGGWGYVPGTPFGFIDNVRRITSYSPDTSEKPIAVGPLNSMGAARAMRPTIEHPYGGVATVPSADDKAAPIDPNRLPDPAWWQKYGLTYEQGRGVLGAAIGGLAGLTYSFLNKKKRAKHPVLNSLVGLGLGGAAGILGSRYLNV